MIPKNDNPFSSLERLFHEPNRLAIMSSVCGAGKNGRTFNELKDDCDLTDGNLSRHLKALEEAGMVRSEKEFVGVKPRTTVFTTPDGVAKFVEYLDNLEAVLKTAAASTAVRGKKGGEKKFSTALAHKPARA